MYAGDAGHDLHRNRGKIELPEGVKLPEGSPVRIEVISEDEWLKDWEDLARRVGAAWNSPMSAVETISEMRR